MSRALPPAFSHVRDWIFDLDNCLYPASTGLFELIDQRMGAYIQQLLDCDPTEARRVQKAHFHEHGTTLAGLMKTNDIDPRHFLDDVHNIPLDRVTADERLGAALSRLPGRRLVFTNGDAPYAMKVLDRLGMGASFEAIHDIHATDYRPKPDPLDYRGLSEAFDLDPTRSLFVEDMARNLKPAKAIGMTTVWIDNGSEQTADEDRGFIDYTIADLGDWLHEILEDQA